MLPEKTLLSGYKGINSGATCSSNGDTIVFTGSKGGESDLFRLHKESGERKILFKDPGINVDPAFSPDNRWLAFVSGRFGTPHIFVAELIWTKNKSIPKVMSQKRLTYAGWYNATPSWSPDSKRYHLLALIEKLAALICF